MGALRAPVATHAHMQDRGAPPVRLVRGAPDHRVTSLALTSAASTPPVLTSDPARQHCMVWPRALAGYFQAQVIQACERAQVGAVKGSIGHVEVFQMDGVGIPIIERPRPLPGHNTPNPLTTPLHPQMRRATLLCIFIIVTPFPVYASDEIPDTMGSHTDGDTAYINGTSGDRAANPGAAANNHSPASDWG